MAANYDASPAQLDVYVSPDEAREIAAGDPKIFTKNPMIFAHYAARVSRTLVHMRTQITNLHRDIQTLQLSGRQSGAPATLSPIEAVRYLTAEQFADVADQMTKSRISAALEAERQARDIYSQAVSRVNEAKLVLRTLTEDVRLSDDARARLAGALGRFNASEKSLGDLGSLFGDLPELS